jgi:hypothetical protein
MPKNLGTWSMMGTNRMIPRYAYHKPFMVKFPDKCEWQKGFKPDIKGGLA